jgi:hypothetical protein
LDDELSNDGGDGRWEHEHDDDDGQQRRTGEMVAAAVARG